MRPVISGREAGSPTRAGQEPAGELRSFGLLLWSSSLAVSLWLLHVAFRPASPLPLAPSRWSTWASSADPAGGVVAALRLVAIVCGWYLVVVTIVGVVARLVGGPAVVEATDRISPPPLRRLLGTARALALSATGLAVAVAPLVAVSPSIDPAHSGERPEGAGMSGPPRDDAGAMLRMISIGAASDVEPVGGAPPVGPSDATAEPFPGHAIVALESDGPVVPTRRSSPTRWRVGPGDHLWSIAEATLADAWGHAPTDDEIAPYWLDLVELNRNSLVSPSNPDLIFPGQEIVLPALPR